MECWILDLILFTVGIFGGGYLGYRYGLTIQQTALRDLQLAYEKAKQFKDVAGK